MSKIANPPSTLRQTITLCDRLTKLAQVYQSLEPFTPKSTETSLRGLAQDMGVPASYFIHPLRKSITGTHTGPPVFDVVAVMGKDRAVQHLNNYVRHLGVLRG